MGEKVATVPPKMYFWLLGSKIERNEGLQTFAQHYMCQEKLSFLLTEGYMLF